MRLRMAVCFVRHTKDTAKTWLYIVIKISY